MPSNPKHEPAQIAMGTEISWTRIVADYPASSGWTLTYYFLAKSGDSFSIIATANGDDFLVSLTSTITKAYKVGHYDWQAYVTSGSVRHLVANGKLEVLHDVSTGLAPASGSFTNWNALYARMKNDLASGSWRVSSYAIEGRTTTYRTFEEFMQAYTWVKQQALTESGNAPPRRVGAQNAYGRWQ